MSLVLVKLFWDFITMLRSTQLLLVAMLHLVHIIDFTYATLIKHSQLKFLWLQDTDSDEDILDEGDVDDEVEDEHDHETEPEVPVHPESEVKKPYEVSGAPKEAERQLSKKERKKKELAELDALLADFGVAPKESDGQDESSGNWKQLSCYNYWHNNALEVSFPESPITFSPLILINIRYSEIAPFGSLEH